MPGKCHQVDRWLVVIVSPAVAFFTLAKHIEENVMEELEVRQSLGGGFFIGNIGT
jgi:hypothetical protein